MMMIVISKITSLVLYVRNACVIHFILEGGAWDLKNGRTDGQTIMAAKPDAHTSTY